MKYRGGIALRILIDADGCPVVDSVIRLAKKAGVVCILLCDTAHVYQKEGVETITLEKGADSVDFALVNMVHKGDIVVTQDYGLAAMCLARRAVPLNQNGVAYTDGNIDALLQARHHAKKVRLAGGKLRGSPKRTAEQNKAFEKALERLLCEPRALEYSARESF